jgi:hypothetical protein
MPERRIVQAGNNGLGEQSVFEYEGVRFYDNRLDLPDGLPFDIWEKMVGVIERIKNGIDWAYGDALNYGERKWGEMYAQAILVTGRSYSSLSTAKSVASVFKPEMRRPTLPFSYHEVVAPLIRHSKEGEAIAMEILDRAENDDRMVLKEIKHDVREAKIYLGIEEAPPEEYRSDRAFLPTPTEIEPRNMMQGAGGNHHQPDYDERTYDAPNPLRNEWTERLLSIVVRLARSEPDDLADVWEEARAFVREHRL